MWGLKTKSDTNLVRLRDSDSFKVAQGDFDVRGWPVIGSDAEKIGRVYDLIFDKVKEKVRYLEIDVDTSFPSVSDKNILVPIGLATIHGENNMVAVKEINQASLKDYPVYHGETISRDYEYSVRDYLTKGITSAASPGYTDRLSPQREQMEYKGKTYPEQEYTKIVHEKELAFSQRDNLQEENNRLKKELEDWKAKYARLEATHENYIPGPTRTTETAYGKPVNESEDDFYSNRFFDCDEFERGIKC